MRRSTDKILTTHVGSLPMPEDLQGRPHTFDSRLQEAVNQVVQFQRRAGIDFVNEGELTKDGNWVQFINSRLSGFVAAPTGGWTAELLTQSDDWREFGKFYERAAAKGVLFEDTGSTGDQTGNMDWICEGPVTYVGQASLKREIDALASALGDLPREDGFLTSTAPTSLEPGRVNRFYKSQEEFVFALSEAMRVEYEAIVQAGFNVQVDDAWTAALWDRIGVKMGLAEYKRWCMVRVEALNHALRNIPVENVRYHLCWGSWHGPHAHDIPLPDIVDVMLAVKAQTYLFEAANVRHEHEYRVWETVKLPAGKILAPGIVSHSTVLIEHPKLVAERIQRFARLVGRENVIASTDCGLGLRCHPQIAWAKLKALTDGAALATKELWGR